MDDLIKTETINDTQYVSSFRELYLDCKMNKSQWSRWARMNINHSSFFMTNKDWIRHDIVSNHNPVIDFKVTLEMSKHLIMMMRTDKAHEYRNYLIKLEKAWNTPEVVMARALQIANNNILGYKDTIIKLTNKLEIQAPMVSLANDCIRDITEHYSITNAGKQLGLSMTKMFNLLVEKRLLTSSKLPTQSGLDRKMITLRTNNVGGKNYPQSVMTMENIFNFKNVYEKDFK